MHCWLICKGLKGGEEREVSRVARKVQCTLSKNSFRRLLLLNQMVAADVTSDTFSYGITMNVVILEYNCLLYEYVLQLHNIVGGSPCYFLADVVGGGGISE